VSKLDDPGLDHLLSAESEQLTRNRRRAICGAEDRFRILVKHRIFSRVLQQVLGVSANYHQKIIEVMGNTAGQLADRFHALRSPELLFQFPFVGDIADDAAKADNSS
jgi:hypothetical protein